MISDRSGYICSLVEYENCIDDMRVLLESMKKNEGAKGVASYSDQNDGEGSKARQFLPTTPVTYSIFPKQLTPSLSQNKLSRYPSIPSIQTILITST